MTLPPVVGDAEVCAVQPVQPPAEAGQFAPLDVLPHDWEPVSIGLGPFGGDPRSNYQRCRYCGGRKPTDAAPSSEGVGMR